MTGTSSYTFFIKMLLSVGFKGREQAYNAGKKVDISRLPEAVRFANDFLKYKAE